MTATRLPGKATERRPLPARFATLRPGENLALAVLLNLAGTNAEGRPFSEVSHTTLINRLGGKLLTTEQLAEGAVVQLTVFATRKTAPARVIWIGEKFGKHYELAVEIDAAAEFWGVQFPGAPAAPAAAPEAPALQPASAAVAPTEVVVPPPPATPMPIAAPMPVAAPMVSAPAAAAAPEPVLEPAPMPEPPRPATPPPISAASISPGDLLLETLRHVVESAIEQTLRPAVERLSREACDDANQKFDSVIGAHSERLELRSIEIVTRNQQSLERNLQEMIDNAEQAMKRRQRELGDQVADGVRAQMLDVALSNKAQLQKEAADVITAASINFRTSVAQQLPELQKQFEEYCHQHVDSMLSGRVAEAGNSLAESVKSAESQVMAKVEGLLDGVRFDLEHHCDRMMNDTLERLEKRFAETAERVSQSFLRHIVGELNERQAQWVDQAIHSIQEAAEQTVKRTRMELARVMKGISESIE